MSKPWIYASVLLLLVSRGAAGQTAVQSVAVTGVVLDQTGAVLPGASVQLVGGGAAVVQSTAADGKGQFRFDRVAAGQYELRAAFEGFKEASTRVRVGTRSPDAQRLVLSLSNLTQEVTVTTGGAEVGANSSNNLDAVAIDQNALEGLPVFDQDYIAMVSRFLDTGSVGSGGATIVVNGMEVSALGVSASAVQQIKINQDPYSAEYARPGRGRIEILTKAGGQEYEGEAHVIFRDAHFDARNGFAATRAPEQKRIFEGVFGGPVGHGGKTSFMLSANDEADDQQAQVVAIGPSGAINEMVPQPNREALVSLSITHQWSDKTMISIRPTYEYESERNRDVGGLTLASAGATASQHEQKVTYMQQTTLSPSLLHQFQVLIGHERQALLSTSAERGIVVAGAFTSGGQGDLVRTESHMQLTESLIWIKGHHQVQGGFQIPDWSRRGSFDRTNFNGTYYFSGLDAHADGQPYAFIQQQGNGDLTFLEKQLGLYIKDDWQVRPGFSASFGVRYDWQNYFHDSNNLAPRGSIAFTPGSRKTDVIRAGLGLFNDRFGAGSIAELLHFRPGGLVRYVISNPSYPDPFQSGAGASQPPSIVQLAPGAQIPQTLQYSIGLDHQLRKGLTMSVTYMGAQGYHFFRSRDINAPPPPFYAERPNPEYGVVREIASDGRQSTQSLQVSLRGKVSRWVSTQAQYTFSSAYNDTNGIGSYPANDYDLSGEWARADFDRPHRLLMLASVNPGHVVDLGVSLALTSAGRYSATLGDDVYNNGRGRARPIGVARNTMVAAGSAQLDLRLSRVLKAGGGKGHHAVTIALDAFNVLNRVNYGTFIGTVGSPLFGQPVSARAPRQLQLSTRVGF